MTALHFIFDRRPGHGPARFIEVETADGRSVNAGEWRDRKDGTVELVVTSPCGRCVTWTGRHRFEARYDEEPVYPPPTRPADCPTETRRTYVGDACRYCGEQRSKPAECYPIDSILSEEPTT